MNGSLRRPALALAACAATLLLHGCTSSSTPAEGRPGTVQVMLGDAPSENWATIGVRLAGVSLLPQGGGTPVPVYTASPGEPRINLAQLDNIAEILDGAPVPAGSYVGAVLTIGADPGDLLLTVAADPEPGFPLAPGTQVPPGQIVIRGATGEPGNRTVAVNVPFRSPLVVSEGGNEAVEIEFDLEHPLFIVKHVPEGGAPLWIVSFSGPVRHRPLPDVRHLVLRHLYATVSAVAANDTKLVVKRELPALPPQDPQIAVTTTRALDVLVDAANGTLFYDLDARTAAVLHDFSSVAGTLPGKHLRVAARYQQDRTLVAVRIWASDVFDKVWVSPEGHVLHVDPANQVLVVSNELGRGVPLGVDADTKFYFRTPVDALADAAPIGTGPAFLASVHRGFKVHASVVDPEAAGTLVASAVDIEIARLEGAISGADATGFTHTRHFADPSDDYVVSPAYVSSTTPNGRDASGGLVHGFQWWSFAYPTLAHAGPGAIDEFIAATSGTASFGGTAAPLVVRGATFATWNDPANPGGWSARWTVLAPSPLPPGTVASDWATGGAGGSFGMTVPGGANAVTVNVSAVQGSATLVYRVDPGIGGGLVITPQDITRTNVMADVAAALVAGTSVKVFGIPQPDGSVKAYVLFFTTDVVPLQ